MLTRHEYEQLDRHFRVRLASGTINGTPPPLPTLPKLAHTRERYHNTNTAYSRRCGRCGVYGHTRRHCTER